MKPRRVYVSYQRDEKFILTVEEYSRVRAVVAAIADRLCALTRHWGCNRGPLAWGMNQDFEHSKTLVRIPISRAEADKLKHREDDWDWLDEVG